MGFRGDRAIPDLGVGVGLRTPHVQQVLGDRPPMDWFEIISENYLAEGGIQRANLESLREGYPVVPHGVSLSIGGTDPLDADYLARLRGLVARLRAPWCSDHLCWTGIGGVDTHDLLPLPMTRASLDHVVERCKRVQGELGVTFALENASTYLEFRESTIPEPEFLAEIAERADCGLLLDVNNVFVSAYNHGFDARAYIDTIPADRVVQIHVAGHTDRGAYLLDTHSDHVKDDVWELYRRALRRCGPTSTLVEWDELIPTWEVLSAEADRARAVRDEVLGKRVKGQPVDLASVQRFFTSAVQRPAPLAEEGELAPQVQVLVVPSARGMTPSDRLEVYREQFWLRHVKSVAEDFPTLAWALGGAGVFADLAREYLRARPPSTWDLQRLGAGMPALVKEHAKHGADALACDAARLDWAFMEVFDAPDAPAFDPRVLAATPEDAWPAARVHMHPALRALTLGFPLIEVRETLKAGAPGGDRPLPAPTHVVVWRDAACFSRAVAIERAAHELLARLAAGEPLGAACEAVGAHAGLSEADIGARVGTWFQEWTQRGWVSRVVL